jgi:septum formation topological specificity factor MinE
MFFLICVACVLGLVLYRNDLRKFAVTAAVIALLYMFASKHKIRGEIPLESTYPTLAGSLKSLEFMQQYNAGDLKSLGEKMHKFVGLHNRIAAAHDRSFQVQQMDVLQDMRRDILENIEFLAMSAPITKNQMIRSAEDGVKAQTHAMIVRLKRVLNIQGDIYPAPM